MTQKKNKKRFYIIGVGGVAMGNLAGLLKQKGYEVAGSDQSEMYDPMKSMLREQNIKVFVPYNALHVKRYDPDIVVIGNTIKRGNSELEHVLSKGHKYRSVSDILREEFIEGKHSIVVAGTHGKTTISALIAWILESAGMDPTVFVGGIINGFPPKVDSPLVDMRNIGAGFKYGHGKYVVLEGDEYGTSFFDKNPKFFGYRPFIGVISNIDLDHIDVFGNIENIQKTFSDFSNLVPNNGLLVMNGENRNSQKIISSHKHVKTFGIKKGNYTASKILFTNGKMMFQVKRHNKKIADISTSLIGYHNVSNILAAFTVCSFIGISINNIINGIATFSGVKRRMEILIDNKGVMIIDDYAHHPTAVKSTIKALRQMFPMKRLIVAFEPGSASSKSRIFEKQYLDALSGSDVVFLFRPYKTDGMKKSEIFNGKALASRLNGLGIKADYFTGVDNLLLHVKTMLKSGDVLITMSCRGFDGFREMILKEMQ